jgi:hypothetical protein
VVAQHRGREQPLAHLVERSPPGEVVALRPILNNASPGQAVYEPFMGSGTTLIAAETTGRACLGIELNPAYVDVAVERWQRFTGKAAVLDGFGGCFSELATARR